MHPPRRVTLVVTENACALQSVPSTTAGHVLGVRVVGQSPEDVRDDLDGRIDEYDDRQHEHADAESLSQSSCPVIRRMRGLGSTDRDAAEERGPE